MPIAWKLGAAMGLLLLAVVAVLALEVAGIRREAAVVRRQTQLAASADGPSRLLINLQNERSWAAVELIGQSEGADLLVEGYDETRRQTDEALAGFEERLADGPAETRRAFAPALDGLAEGLRAVRERIDAETGPRTLDNLELSDESFTAYTELVDPFFNGLASVALAVDHPDLRRGAELLGLSTRQVEALGLLGREVGITSLLTSGGIDQREEIAAVAVLRWRFNDLAHQLHDGSTGPYAAAGDEQLLVDYPAAVDGQVEAAMQGAFDTEAMLDTMTPSSEDTYLGYRERVADILVDRAERIDDDATRRERLFLLLVAMTAATATGLMVLAARSVTRPLRSLTDQVMNTAHEGLPEAVATVLRTPVHEDVVAPAVEPLRVEGADEVSDLAGVMNTVQRAVVELAVEQAVLRRNLADSFLSLGRRNQHLLSRQLDFLTQLQRQEMDPDVLGHLFRLDHLATRMRRNAESLLVLAGNESPRRWPAPVPVLDVVRAAVSEVEDYQRVGLRGLDPFTVLGSAAADLAHLLAELIENALAFSPPHAPVEIRGVARPAGGMAYTLWVVDNGVGMSAADLARANRRLAGAELLTIAPSKYLGHYVAGNLAVRHGIELHLQNSPATGITAVITLPLAISPVTTPSSGSKS